MFSLIPIIVLAKCVEDSLYIETAIKTSQLFLRFGFMTLLSGKRLFIKLPLIIDSGGIGNNPLAYLKAIKGLPDIIRGSVTFESLNGWYSKYSDLLKLCEL